MNKVDDLLKKLKNFNDNAEEIAINEALVFNDIIEQMNREQLLQGKKADSATMPNYVANSKFGTGTINLVDKGDFHGGFKASKKSKVTIAVSSTDFKADFLVKYGDIFGLTKANLDIFRQDYLIPAMQKQLKKSLL